MRWQDGRRSDNVEDRRGAGGGLGPGLGGGGFRLGGRGGLGIGGTIIVLLIALFFGVDPRMLLGGGDAGYAPAPGYQTDGDPQVAYGPPPAAPGAQDAQSEFVRVVLGYTEDVWNQQFQRLGQDYREPTLVLFSGSVQSGCGSARASMGPFYCPLDEKLYIDLSFYDELRKRLGAPGDFAQAYVIAHEVGHHVQNLLGISGQVQEARRAAGSEAESNALSVRLELQADCLAGVWAHHTQERFQVLEAGDVQEAMGAAAAVGDDRLQHQSRGYAVPDSFTHGSAEQRTRWFDTGFRQGTIEACNTFRG